MKVTAISSLCVLLHCRSVMSFLVAIVARGKISLVFLFIGLFKATFNQ